MISSHTFLTARAILHIGVLITTLLWIVGCGDTVPNQVSSETSQFLVAEESDTRRQRNRLQATDVTVLFQKSTKRNGLQMILVVQKQIPNLCMTLQVTKAIRYPIGAFRLMHVPLLILSLFPEPTQKNYYTRSGKSNNKSKEDRYLVRRRNNRKQRLYK